MPGTLYDRPAGTTLTFQPSRPYFAAESVYVRGEEHDHFDRRRAARRTDSSSTFWVKPLAGSGTFSLLQTINIRNPGENTIATYGIFAGDLDGDGSPDITAPNEASNDVRVFLNSGCGTFGPKTTYPIPGQRRARARAATSTADGILDLLTGNQAGNAASVLFGNGIGRVHSFPRSCFRPAATRTASRRFTPTATATSTSRRRTARRSASS